MIHSSCSCSMCGIALLVTLFTSLLTLAMQYMRPAASHRLMGSSLALSSSSASSVTAVTLFLLLLFLQTARRWPISLQLEQTLLEVGQCLSLECIETEAGDPGDLPHVVVVVTKMVL